MKFFTALLLCIFIGACTAKIQPPQSENGGSFILTNVNVVDVSSQKIVSNQTILIENGRVKTVTNNNPFSATSNLPVIDGKNGYVTPGLIDMHVHMYEKAAYMLTLSHGVTHVRIMNGVAAQLKWRDLVDQGKMIGSSSSVSSPILSGYQNAPLHHSVQNAQEGRDAVSLYHAQGYDLIKAYGSLNAESLNAIVKRAKQLNMPVAKHGPHASGDMPLSSLTGLQSFEHVEDIYQGPLNYEFEPAKLPAIIDELKQTQVPITPTLNIFHQLTRISQDKEDYLATTSAHYTSDIIAFETKRNQTNRWVNASDRMAKHNQRTFDFLTLITGEFHHRKIPLLVGSDSGVLLSPHGIATHTEMELLQKAGLNDYETLAAATINPAKALRMETELGQVSSGFKADFIYSTENPIGNLATLKQPDAVVKTGHWYSKEELVNMRNEALNNRSFWQELKVLYEAL